MIMGICRAAGGGGCLLGCKQSGLSVLGQTAHEQIIFNSAILPATVSREEEGVRRSGGLGRSGQDRTCNTILTVNTTNPTAFHNYSS